MGEARSKKDADLGGAAVDGEAKEEHDETRGGGDEEETHGEKEGGEIGGGVRRGEGLGADGTEDETGIGGRETVEEILREERGIGRGGVTLPGRVSSTAVTQGTTVFPASGSPSGSQRSRMTSSATKALGVVRYLSQ